MYQQASKIQIQLEKMGWLHEVQRHKRKILEMEITLCTWIFVLMTLFSGSLDSMVVGPVTV
jgi:hypothetical protein